MPAAHPVLRLREAIPLNQSDFALQAGLSASHLSRVESGQKPLGYDAAQKIAKRFQKQMQALGIELIDLIKAGRG